MDPHTARCLQLSTSINMPFSPFRPHRFADPMNRSRYHASNPGQRMRPNRSNTMPSNSSTWTPPQFQARPYHQSATPPATSQHGYSKSQVQIATTQTMHPQSLDFDSYFASFSPDDMLMTNPWAGDDLKPLQTNGLDMAFPIGPVDFTDMTPLTNSASTVTNMDDLFSPANNTMWDLTTPSSPDRRSWSSMSSGDISDVPEMVNTSSLPSGLVSRSDVPFENDSTPKPFTPQTRVGRSRSRPPPTSRANSNRRYRTSPYPSGPTQSRSSSVISNSHYCHSRSASQIYVPPHADLSNSQYLEDVTEVNCSPVDAHNPMAMDMVLFELPGSNDFDNMFDGGHLIAPQPQHTVDASFMAAQLEEAVAQNPQPPVLPSSTGFDMKPDPAQDPSGIVYADEPDLYGRLSEAAIEPPEEDLNPEDAELKPTVQEPRWDGDLYTPRYVRGHGLKREGWCGLCKGGRWLVLKNSAFWYDKSFTHGISAATGQPFDKPRETRRMAGNPDVWEGLCGSCNDWIPLISSKKKGTTWFRHAYKCHNHQKAKDMPKRRRESSVAAKVAPKVSPTKPAEKVMQEIKQEEHHQHHQHQHQHQHQHPRQQSQNIAMERYAFDMTEGGESALQSIGFML